MFVPKSSIDDKASLVQVMACCVKDAKPLPEPMMTTQFTSGFDEINHVSKTVDKINFDKEGL